jgi:addiction module HigA family antidote
MTELKAGPRRRKPTHPGAIVKRELEALGITPYAAAPAIGVTRMALGNIIAEKSAVSPEMALRLGKFFDNGPELSLGLQADVDIWNAREKLKGELAKIRPAARDRAAS